VVPDHPVVAVPTFTLRPQHGIKAVLTPRGLGSGCCSSIARET
jgi:hypothetical protein